MVSLIKKRLFLILCIHWVSCGYHDPYDSLRPQYEYPNYEYPNYEYPNYEYPKLKSLYLGCSSEELKNVENQFPVNRSFDYYHDTLPPLQDQQKVNTVLNYYQAVTSEIQSLPDCHEYDSIYSPLKDHFRVKSVQNVINQIVPLYSLLKKSYEAIKKFSIVIQVDLSLCLSQCPLYYYLETSLNWGELSVAIDDFLKVLRTLLTEYFMIENDSKISQLHKSRLKEILLKDQHHNNLAIMINQLKSIQKYFQTVVAGDPSLASKPVRPQQAPQPNVRSPNVRSPREEIISILNLLGPLVVAHHPDADVNIPQVPASNSISLEEFRSFKRSMRRLYPYIHPDRYEINGYDQANREFFQSSFRSLNNLLEAWERRL